MDTVEDVLEHFGIKGMQWGVRRNAHGDSSSGASDDALRVASSKKKIKKGSTKALTTKELQDVVNRMNLEQQYSRLTAKPSKVKKGLSFVNGVLNAGNTVNQAIQFSNSPVGKMLGEQLKSKVSTA